MDATIPTQTVLVDGLRIRYADSGTADGSVVLFTPAPGQKASSPSGASGRPWRGPDG